MKTAKKELETQIKFYEAIVTTLIKAFEEKQELEFEFWVADVIGEVACLSGYYFNFTDIMIDLKTNQPKGLIIEWLDTSLDYNNDKEENQRRFINYWSYAKGLRYEDLK